MFDFTNLQKVMTEIDIPEEVKKTIATIPQKCTISPYKLYDGLDEEDKLYFTICIKQFTKKLINTVKNNDCYLAYNYTPDYESNDMDEFLFKKKRNDVYNYALDVFNNILVDKGYNPNKQFINSNCVYIEVVLHKN